MTSTQNGNAKLLLNTGDGRYARYFTEVEKSLGMIVSWGRNWSGGALTLSAHTDYLRGLGACFSMLQSRFNFETTDTLMIDAASGYPHSFMLARLASDRAEALSQHLKGEGLDTAQLKQVFLNDLFQTGEINPALLNRIACVKYAEVVSAMDGAFDPRFMCGTPQLDAGKRYRLQWGVFDPVLNVPVVCGMVFEYSGLDLTRSLAGLKVALRHETKAAMSISALAQNIDTAVADIHPLALSRATLGPVHIPILAEQHAPYALPCLTRGEQVVIDITVDHTHAISVRKPTTLAVRFGVSPAEQRIYHIRTDDPLCYQRGASAVERVVILPHRVLQGIPAEDQQDSMGSFTLVPYIKDGELQ